MKQRRRMRNRASRSAIVAAGIAAVVLCVARASRAQTVPPDLERIVAHSESNNEPQKFAEAKCPFGKRVVGGGGWVFDGNRNLVRLNGLIPYGDASGNRFEDRFTATAEAPNLFSPYDWSIDAYALCINIDALEEYQLVYSSITVPSSGGPFAHTAAVCPGETVAFGAGAWIQTGTGTPNPGSGEGKIGLQLNRVSGPLDISRAAARETVEGYFASWRLLSAAICARPIGDIHAEGTIAPDAVATHNCSLGNSVVGPGGGGTLTDGGPVWLQKIYPRANLKFVDVALTGPLDPAIGGMVAHTTCALLP